jgi:hypothetical protein
VQQFTSCADAQDASFTNIKVIDEAYNFTNIEITINNSTELLSIFHAGVLAGCDASSAKRA